MLSSRSGALSYQNRQALHGWLTPQPFQPKGQSPSINIRERDFGVWMLRLGRLEQQCAAELGRGRSGARDCAPEAETANRELADLSVQMQTAQEDRQN